MKRTLHCQSVQIPFREKFAHNTATREETETVVVSIRNEKGLTGYGESCPRKYVTGETIESCLTFIEEIKDAVLILNTIEELQHFIAVNSQKIDKNPAAFCALELAMIDLMAKENNLSAGSLLKLDVKHKAEAKDEATYTAVLGIETWAKFLKKLFLYKLMGFQDFKLKISGEEKKDHRKIKFLSVFAQKIRLDGNNVFQNEKEAIAYLKPILPCIWAIEEPLQVSDFGGMKKISEECGLTIILDESFKNIDDLRDLNEQTIPNLRISKMGGILRTLKIIHELKKSNRKWILGSHVGEMSLLTKAQLLISRQFPETLALEGGFGTFLLKDDYFIPNLRLSAGAKIRHNISPDEKGFGQELRMKT